MMMMMMIKMIGSLRLSRAQRGNPTRLQTLSGRRPGCLYSLHLSLAILFLLCLQSFAQDQKQPVNPIEPTITFDLLWEAATPQNYTITVASSGKAKYVSRNPTRP